MIGATMPQLRRNRKTQPLHHGTALALLETALYTVRIESLHFQMAAVVYPDPAVDNSRTIFGSVMTIQGDSLNRQNGIQTTFSLPVVLEQLHPDDAQIITEFLTFVSDQVVLDQAVSSEAEQMVPEALRTLIEKGKT